MKPSVNACHATNRQYHMAREREREVQAVMNGPVVEQTVHVALPHVLRARRHPDQPRQSSARRCLRPSHDPSRFLGGHGPLVAAAEPTSESSTWRARPPADQHNVHYAAPAIIETRVSLRDRPKALVRAVANEAQVPLIASKGRLVCPYRDKPAFVHSVRRPDAETALCGYSWECDVTFHLRLLFVSQSQIILCARVDTNPGLVVCHHALLGPACSHAFGLCW